MADCPLKSGKRLDPNQMHSILPQDVVPSRKTNPKYASQHTAYLSQGMVSVLCMPHQCCRRGLSDDVAAQKNSSQDEIRTSELECDQTIEWHESTK